MTRHFTYLDTPCPIAFAHRGGALEAEENTLAAFKQAADLGYRYIETDVQATRDGVAVVFHDESLERLTNAQGFVSNYSWAELNHVRTKGGQAIPCLEEVLDAFPGQLFNIDPKSDLVVEPLAQAITVCNAVPRVCVASFDGGRVRRLRRLLGKDLCWAPGHKGVASLWLSAHGVKLPTGFPTVQVPPRYKGIPLVTSRLVHTARKRGVQVHVWTIDEEDEMERLLDLGVDGIMTDRPSLLKEVLVRRNQWQGG
ncbi:glycerophosphodiester phosphodiesterase [Fodinicurvata halophila]|uniref:Glycerophosphodiester phosphodiesterase n=1 Tax=Fodinicurvata halophila TaxID=1419723 RepID=A0ABV8UKD6_9PROT